MNASIITHSRIPLGHTAFKAAACVTVLAALLALATTARAQSDDFNSGSDASWNHITAPKYPATYSFPTDVFGGHAYQMQATTPANPSDKNIDTARALAVREDTTYTDFYVAVDLVNWNKSTDDSTNDQFIGVIARASSIDSGLLNGIIFLFEPNYQTQTSPTPGPSTGVAALGWIIGGSLQLLPSPGQPGVVPAGLAYATLDPTRSYRLVLQGTGSGYTGQITGKVYDLQDLTHPLLTISGDTSAGALYGSVPTSGYSGLFIANGSTNAGAICDVTFDNFVAAAAPPTSVASPAVPHGLAGAPQVINRTPASWANFHPAASGISLTATTLTTTNTLNTSATRLILNGADVSSSLTITPTSPATNATVSSSGLVSNTVYDASIILQDVNGHRTTNVWTFDTFSDAFLASAPCLNIECEDYDGGGGSWIDNPIASGYSTNDNFTVGGYVFPVNDNPIGYVGIAAGLEGQDFHDWSSKATYGSTNIGSPALPSCEFRTYGCQDGDPVGVNEGVAFDAHIVGLTINYARAWDTKRQKYVDASVTGLAEWGSVDPNFDVEEYLVMATEGGEWLNYTRTNFNGSYIVYLRHGCALTEQVNLYKLGGTDPNPLNHTFTNLLGTFYCTNAMMWNYRYAPLLDASGKPAVVSLTNQTTLRLEIAPPQQDSTKYGMAMNYLAFVPYVATPMKLYSTAQVKGSGTVWTEETSATVDTANHRITVAQNGTRYYQVRWSSKTKVTGVSRSGLNIILTYQEVP